MLLSIDGGRYDPAANAWVETSTTAAPSARVSHTAVWTGQEMIVWGSRGGGLENTGGRYDPAMDSWAATSPTGAPSQRFTHTAVWTGRAMIVWGGLGGRALNRGGVYRLTSTLPPLANQPVIHGQRRERQCECDGTWKLNLDGQ